MERMWLLGVPVKSSIMKQVRDYLRTWNVPRKSTDANSTQSHCGEGKCIGFHVRMGQDATKYKYESTEGYTANKRTELTKNRAASHYDYFIEVADKTWRHDPLTVILLCADDQRIYDAFNSHYADRIGKTLVYTDKKNWDRCRDQLTNALVDVLLLANCDTIYGSPWSSFTELVTRIASQPPKLLLAGKDFGVKRYAVLCYPQGYNIGDDIQSIAAERLLPRVDYVVNRDDQTVILDVVGDVAFQTPDKSPAITVVENGWFDGRITSCRLHSCLTPLFISFHLNESAELFQDKRYDVLRIDASRMDVSRVDVLGVNSAVTAKLLDDPAVAEMMRRNGPVGCRDEHTRKCMSLKNIPSYLSSCLTLTLGTPVPAHRGILSSILSHLHITSARQGERLIVDAYIGDDANLLRALVPKSELDAAVRITHGLESHPTLQARHAMTIALLERYRRAKWVVTNRLHCALPCLTFGTPVVFVHRDMNGDPRFDSTLQTLLGNGRSLPHDWSWDNPCISPHISTLVNGLAAELRKRFYSVIDA